MKSKLNYLVGVSLKRKIKTKWFLIANIVLAIILVGIINIDSIITMFGGDFNEKTNVYVLDNTNKTYDIFISQFNNANSLLTNSGEESEYNIIKEERSLDELKNLINNDEKEKDSIIIVFNDSETNYLDVSLITKEYIDLIFI